MIEIYGLHNKAVCYCSELEKAAEEQIRAVCDREEFSRSRIRIMPDVHSGTGCTIGTTMTITDKIVPGMVGVDIGCGMAAVRTSLTLVDLPDDLHGLRLAIEGAVPVGYRGNDGEAAVLRGDVRLRGRFDALFGRFGELRAPRIADRRSRALSQCGSLGGGNHFIELCVAEGDERLWLTLHSGSRNIGKELAERHIATAKTLEHNLGLPDRDLAVFLAGTSEMDSYLSDLWWAQDYAMLSRTLMLATVQGVFARWHPGAVGFDEPILCHHNYVARESYDHIELIVTRKGAIRAAQGDLGLIPGSMGTGSYVVRGLGNEASLNSASHGAGRRMSRTRAKRTFTTEDLAAQTAGVECRKDAGVVDEIPGAYKDIDQVIAAQVDLVEVVARLQTLLCVKG